jgi:4-hydroxy-tetrahydrodipicolinate reductase
MKIALLGYGKMGKIIEKIALDRKHEIVLKIDQDNQHELTAENLQNADVAIEFTMPASVRNNLTACLDAGTPVVVGTTGWYDQFEAVKQECAEKDGTLMYGTNYSVGVNIFFHINKMLAKIMNNYPYYDVQVEEIHHTQKLDSPSGTAITIAEGIIDGIDVKNSWANVLVANDNNVDDSFNNAQVLIESHRIDNVPGTHTVIYDSEVDTLEFKHTAHNRNGFALGAVLAAEWLQDKKGFHAITDMFNFTV